MTQTMVFGLLVGWLGGWAIVAAAKRRARQSIWGAVSALTGEPLRVARWVMIPAAVSLGCAATLALAGLWAIAAAVTR